MKPKTVFNILKYLLVIVFAVSGIAIVFLNTNIWVVLGIFFIIWSNNIDRAKYEP